MGADILEIIWFMIGSTIAGLVLYALYKLSG